MLGAEVQQITICIHLRSITISYGTPNVEFLLALALCTINHSSIRSVTPNTFGLESPLLDDVISLDWFPSVRISKVDVLNEESAVNMSPPMCLHSEWFHRSVLSAWTESTFGIHDTILTQVAHPGCIEPETITVAITMDLDCGFQQSYNYREIVSSFSCRLMKSTVKRVGDGYLDKACTF